MFVKSYPCLNADIKVAGNPPIEQAITCFSDMILNDPWHTSQKWKSGPGGAAAAQSLDFT